ncbi:MAG: alpha-glucosidase/alpha-galactosidase [Caldilineaceae bacterium]|nr:alpha-glucosidase/alpha-galactosidase [Caldilineaceae bacterium]
MTKITLVGAGSTSFGLGMLLDLAAYGEELAGSTIVLNDVNPNALDLMLQAGRLLNGQGMGNLHFEGTTDLDAALDGAEFVITSVAVDRAATWQRDWEIPIKHGIKHVLGENGGPGGLGHTLRSVNLMVELARRIEAAAPDAWVLNFTNPLTRVCLGLERATNLKVVGLCHGIGGAYRTVGITMGLVQEVEEARAQRKMLEERFDIKAAGLNHFTFIYSIFDNERGIDIYPEFRERLAAMPANFQPLSRRLLDAFGLFPAIGDGHTGEYISFAWETSELKGYDFDGYAQHAGEAREKLRQFVAGQVGAEEYAGRTSGERAIPFITAMLANKNQFELALNITNRGSIQGLPDWAIVEVPAIVSASGVQGLTIPDLPPGITALLAQQVAVQDRAVEAALHGDRQAALQALLLDPVIPSYEAAIRILDELLRVHAPYLPQFAERVPS